jgi:hypothetical protein
MAVAKAGSVMPVERAWMPKMAASALPLKYGPAPRRQRTFNNGFACDSPLEEGGFEPSVPGRNFIASKPGDDDRPDSQVER